MVLALTLASCLDEKMKVPYYLFAKSSSPNGNISVKYDLDNIKKKRYAMQNLPSGILYLEVRNFVYHLKKPVFDCEVSILNNTGETLQLYATRNDVGLNIDDKFVDLRSVWLYAQRGEVIEGLISVDSVFRYLKNTNNKGYFEIPSNSNGEFFTFQMPDLQ